MGDAVRWIIRPETVKDWRSLWNLRITGAVAVRTLIEGQVYGVSPFEPSVLLGVSALLAMVALVACLAPGDERWAWIP